MEPSEDAIIRELYMLTGKVNKDKNYLYYLLIKDGSYYKEDKSTVEVVKDTSTVDSFEDWFNSI